MSSCSAGKGVEAVSPCETQGDSLWNLGKKGSEIGRVELKPST